MGIKDVIEYCEQKSREYYLDSISAEAHNDKDKEKTASLLSGTYFNMGSWLDDYSRLREKEIAKTPTVEGDGYDEDGNIIYDTWYCPNCDKSYELEYEEYTRCPECGQLIDWKFLLQIDVDMI